MKKQRKHYLKESVETTLVLIQTMIIIFCGMTIDNIGNNLYDKMLVACIIIFILIYKILLKYSRTFNEM
jgi:hypothetical protein